MNERIVVTGTGVVCSIGTGENEFETALFEGRSGVSAGGAQPCPGAGICEFKPEAWLGNRGWRGLDRSARLHSVASFMALEASGLAPPADDGHPDVGLVCGTMFGSLHTIASFDRSALQEGPNLVRPMEFANAAINSCTDQAAIRLRLRGMTSTVSAGLASGLVAIDHAVQSLRVRRARALLAGGVDALCEELFSACVAAGLVSPSGAIRPFAAFRDGIVPGEGSAVLVLETEQGARSRGVSPRLEVCGVGSARSPHPGAWDDAAGSAIRLAIDAAGIGPEGVSCIVTSGSGSLAGDHAEALALTSVFGTRLGDIPACAPKAGFGECMGASGALLALVAGIALKNHRLPPTPGSPDNEHGLRLSPEPQSFAGSYALVNAFGCGNNAALVLRSLNP